MDGPSRDDDAPRRIRLVSILTASAAVAVIVSVSFIFARLSEVYAFVKAPMPGLTLLLVSISPPAWWAIALGMGGLLSLKDLWVREKTSTTLNWITVPLLLLLLLAAVALLMLPLQGLAPKP